MEITYTKRNGDRFSNATEKPLVFKNIKERMRYIINFLNDKANSKTSKDNPSHLKGAKFMFLKTQGDYFDTIEFRIGGKPEDVNTLIDIVYE